MYKTVLYSIFAIAVFIMVECMNFEVPLGVRAIAFFIYFPLIYLIFRLIIAMMILAISPAVEAMEDYVEKIENKRFIKKLQNKKAL